MSKFDELLAQLADTATDAETLAKAMPDQDDDNNDDDEDDDDQNIADATDDDSDEGDDDKDDRATLTKSMTAIDADGNEIEAIDATELLKSLGNRIGATETALTKALTSTLTTIQHQTEQLKTQGDLIKSMSARLDQLAGTGRGRKSVIAVTERPAAGEQLAKSQSNEIKPEQIMAKALDAQKAGKISGSDVARCELHLQSGSVIPSDLLARIQ